MKLYFLLEDGFIYQHEEGLKYNGLPATYIGKNQFTTDRNTRCLVSRNCVFFTSIDEALKVAADSSQPVMVYSVEASLETIGGMMPERIE